MSLSIEQLRANFKKNDQETTGNSRPNNYYPFWNIAEGSTAQVRFLPDANQDNPMGFMVEKLMHNLVINGEKKNTPCLKMYGEDCPICKVSAAYYKDEDKVNGKKYWRKKQHIAQVLVKEDPMPPTDDSGETHEGKLRFVAMGFQIFNIIKDAFESGELDEVPFAFSEGTDFLIKKTKQGEHASYSLSKFARRSTDLTEDEVALAQEQSIDLATLLPPNPGYEKTEALLEAALTGAAYEEGSSSGASDSETNFKSIPKKSPAKEKPAVIKEEKAPVEEAASDDEYNDEADALLQQIRARQAKKA